MFGKQEEVRFHPRLLHLENLGADVGLLGDVVIRDKGLNIEGVGSGLGIIQLIVPLQPRPPRRLAGAGDQNGFPFQPLQRANIGVGQQPLGIILKGGGNGFGLESPLNAFQQLQIVADNDVSPF